MSTTSTAGAAGNALASQSLAGGASVTFNFDCTTVLGGFAQITSTPGSTVAASPAPSGLLVQAFSTSESGGTPQYDTIPFGGANFYMASVASTLSRQSMFVPTGKFQIKLTNLDATNAITIQATTMTVAG